MSVSASVSVSTSVSVSVSVSGIESVSVSVSVGKRPVLRISQTNTTRLAAGSTAINYMCLIVFVRQPVSWTISANSSPKP